MPPRPSLRALVAPCTPRVARIARAQASTSVHPTLVRPGPSPSLELESESSSSLPPNTYEGSSTLTTPGHASSSTPVSSVASSSLVEAATSARIYTLRKTFLWNYYTHLIQRSELVLVFDHSNLSAGEWARIRRAITAIPAPKLPFDPSSPSSPSSSSSSSPANPPNALAEKATLTVVRTGVLSSLASSLSSPLSPHLIGQRALLTSPTLSPTYLAKVLSTLTRTLKSLKRENTADAKQPRLDLVVGIVGGEKVFDVPALAELGKVPELDVLRAQVVGLLEGQGRQLLGLLGQAGGGGLVRTLQGLESDLKAKEEGPAA